MNRFVHSTAAARAFTLIELVMAMAGSALILSAVYGVFSRAIHLRDEATVRTREARVRAHAISVLRNDLLNLQVSGLENGFAQIFEGDATSPNGSFPGHLKFTATTGAPTSSKPTNDLQIIEYYVVTDSAAEKSQGGVLVRAITNDLQSDVAPAPREEPLLHGVQSLEVAFNDAGSWQESYQYQAGDPTLPGAVRVRIQMAPAGSNATASPPLEVLLRPKVELLKW